MSVISDAQIEELKGKISESLDKDNYIYVNDDSHIVTVNRDDDNNLSASNMLLGSLLNTNTLILKKDNNEPIEKYLNSEISQVVELRKLSDYHDADIVVSLSKEKYLSTSEEDINIKKEILTYYFDRYLKDFDVKLFTHKEQINNANLMIIWINEKYLNDEYNYSWIENLIFGCSILYKKLNKQDTNTLSLEKNK